jgi:hypothetical protein
MDGELSLLRWSSSYGWRALPIMYYSCFPKFHLYFFTISFLNSTFCMWTVGKDIATSSHSEEDFMNSEASFPALSPPTMPMMYHIVIDVNGFLCNAESGSKGHINWRLGMLDFLYFCIHYFFVVFWSSCGNKKMLRYMDEIQKRASLNIPSHNILWQEHCYQAKGVDDVNPQKPVLKKPLGRLFERFPHVTVENMLLIDDSPMKNALNYPDQAIHLPPYVDDNTGIGFSLEELEEWLGGLRDSHKPVQEYVSRNRPPLYSRLVYEDGAKIARLLPQPDPKVQFLWNTSRGLIGNAAMGIIQNV